MTDPDETQQDPRTDQIPQGDKAPSPSPAVQGEGEPTTEISEGPQVDGESDLPQPVADTAPDPLVDLGDAVAHLLVESEKYHERSRHRESIIDKMHAELETVRAGERRSTVRPLLVAIARLRDDMIRQSSQLPENFNAERARLLLQSFADSIEITLEDFGVATVTPESGDEFDPRRHKAVTSESTADPALAKRISEVSRDGYVDVEASQSLTLAEVAVYVLAVPSTVSATEDSRPDDGDSAFLEEARTPTDASEALDRDPEQTQNLSE